MSISVQSASQPYSCQVALVKSQSIVEIRFSGREAGEVIAVYPQVSLSSCEIASGRVTYGGRLICTVVYADNEGKLCRVQKGVEFSHHADDESFASAFTPVCTLSCERTQIRRDGSSYAVAVVVGAKISVYGTTERRVVTAAEGAITLTGNLNFCSEITFAGESEVEDSFDCNAEDVLIPAAEVLVTECNVRAGTAEICGEIYMSLLAVREGKPVCLDRIVPFKSQVACEQALLARQATCSAQIKELSVEAKVDEERGKCTVDAVVTLCFSGRYFDEEQANAVLDAFSAECELNIDFAEEKYNSCTQTKVFSERVNGLCATKAKLDYSCALLAVALPKVEFVRSDKGAEGSVCATLLYEQNGEIRSTEMNLPFAVEFIGLNDCVGEINAAVCGVSIRQKAEGECEAEAVLKFTVADGESKTIKFVTDVSEGDVCAKCNSAISVYIPDEGDDLWGTAKKLKRSPDEIKQTNPALSFPLSGNERIVIYRCNVK